MRRVSCPPFQRRTAGGLETTQRSTRGRYRGPATRTRTRTTPGRRPAPHSDFCHSPSFEKSGLRMTSTILLLFQRKQWVQRQHLDCFRSGLATLACTSLSGPKLPPFDFDQSSFRIGCCVSRKCVRCAKLRREQSRGPEGSRARPSTYGGRYWCLRTGHVRSSRSLQGRFLPAQRSIRSCVAERPPRADDVAHRGTDRGDARPRNRRTD